MRTTSRVWAGAQVSSQSSDCTESGMDRVACRPAGYKVAFPCLAGLSIPAAAPLLPTLFCLVECTNCSTTPSCCLGGQSRTPSPCTLPRAALCTPLLPLPGTNYSATQLWGPPKLPLGGLWRPWVRMDRGSLQSVPLARHQALIDANFHQDQPGIVLRNGSGAWSGQLSINTATLTPGWHKLTLQVGAPWVCTKHAAGSGLRHPGCTASRPSRPSALPTGPMGIARPSPPQTLALHPALALSAALPLCSRARPRTHPPAPPTQGRWRCSSRSQVT